MSCRPIAVSLAFGRRSKGSVRLAVSQERSADGKARVNYCSSSLFRNTMYYGIEVHGERLRPKRG